ncbi:origin recognition complex, subunit 4 [Nadsonia fulvescens var. elongata DSM 6958]|uniref:Origin recognition complex subunit 4 n=1 Tax=Nadsonia fulvescens var. elongata DSM 6958 TaxID=857566 RepID=A0A1E3PJP3_9ASCO|nr:origin recognition complex, subunit 4 [Nadsonia fulvescens var. elongata DSM 6958]
MSSDIFNGVTVSKRVLKRVLSHVTAKLTGRQSCQLCLLDEEYSKLYQLLQQTIEEGEGNSCLLVGPKSSGKTLLVSTVVESLRKKYSGQFITVKLSGHAQTDDRIALREITRQIDLHLQNIYTTNEPVQTEPTTLQKRSMSETLQSLLKIFSQYEDDEENNKEIVSVIFILEEFDKFAQHGRQTLLYNLFDIAQSSKAPIAVIGVTAKINARDMLEKRVRSRFSQRIHQLERASSLENFWIICKSSLTVDAAEFISEYVNNKIWNQYIEWLYSDKQGNFYRILEQVFYTTKDVREFFNKILLGMIMSNPFPKQANFLLYEREKSIADTQGFIEGLSELELSLIICAARVQIKLEIESLNFNLVYEEYFQVASQFKQERIANMSSLSRMSNSGMGAGYRIWSRDIARAGWERLESMNLLIGLGGSTGNRGMGANARDEIKMMKVDVGLMEIAKIMGSRHPLKQWTRL